MSAQFELFDRGTGVAFGTCGDIWVMIVFAPPTTADMHLARRSLRLMWDRHPEGFPTLTWVLPSAGNSMSSETRNAASTVTNEFSEAFIAQATLVEGTGFRAASARAILAGIELMTFTKATKKIFANLESSVNWCVSHRPPGPNVSALHIRLALEAMQKSLT